MMEKFFFLRVELFFFLKASPAGLLRPKSGTISRRMDVKFGLRRPIFPAASPGELTNIDEFKHNQTKYIQT
jgi:hypothetical protein